jgi:hypothetical protein
MDSFTVQMWVGGWVGGWWGGGGVQPRVFTTPSSSKMVRFSPSTGPSPAQTGKAPARPTTQGCRASARFESGCDRRFGGAGDSDDYIYLYIYIHVCVCVYMSTCLYICMSKYLHTPTHTREYISAYVNVRTDEQRPQRGQGALFGVLPRAAGSRRRTPNRTIVEPIFVREPRDRVPVLRVL